MLTTEQRIIEIAVLALAGGVLTVLLNWYLDRIFKQSTIKIVNDFAAAFPGRCLICSYHEFGVREGLTNESLSQHDCIEKRDAKP